MLKSALTVAAVGLGLAAGAAAAEDLTSCRQAVDAWQAYEAATAIELVTQCIESGDLQPDNLARAHFFRGSALHQLQALEQALLDYNAALRIDPDYKDAYFQRGAFFVAVSDFMKAIPDFTETLRLDPTDIEALVLRGIAAYELREYRSAVADFTEALRLNPNDREALVARSRAYEALGDTERAAADRKEASGL